MKFTGVHRTWLLGQALDVSNDVLGAWLRVSSYASSDGVESDTLVGARAWNERSLTVRCHVTFADIEAVVAAGLARWDGDDLVIDGFDSEGVAIVQARRAGGKLGGRPRKTSTETSHKPEVSTSQETSPRTSPVTSTKPLSSHLTSDPILSDPAAEPKRADPLSAQQAPVMIFPASGAVGEWNLTPEWLVEARAAYPGVDVETELRLALAKIRTGAVRKPTAKGMSRFLMNWLGRSNDRGPSRMNGTPSRKQPPLRAVDMSR